MPLVSLFDAVTLLLSQFRLEVAVLDRQRTIRHVRTLIASLIHDYLTTRPPDLRELRLKIEEGLKRIRRTHKAEYEEHQEYIDYCLREVALAFELADQIYVEYRTQPDVACTLIDDLPILRPFDYGSHKQKAKGPLVEPDEEAVVG